MRFTAFASIIVAAQLALAAEDGSEARKQLLGVWKGRVQDGATGHQITFTNELITGVKDGTRDLGKGSYTLDLANKPWRMDATEVKDDGKKGRQYFGIYKLEGDSLTWCVGTKETPTTFETGNGQFMLVLKRLAMPDKKAAKTRTSPTTSTQPSKVRVAELGEGAPNKLSAKVRETLGESGLRITGSDGKAVCDIWLRQDVPVPSASSNSSAGKYPLESGTLVGAVRISRKNAGDFRDLKIAPGVYTLRYALQPEDDIHEFTAQFQDFLVLLSAADDVDPARISDAQELSLRGIEATGEGHPAILYLSPPQTGRKNLPAMLHASGSDANTRLAILVVKTTAKGNESIQEVQLELVVDGYAQE